MLSRLTLAFCASIACTILAACGVANSHSAGLPVPGAVSTTAPPYGGLASSATKTMLTVSFTRYSATQRPNSATRRAASSVRHRYPQTATGRRSPNYVSNGVEGFQIAVSAGGETATSYFSASGSACATSQTYPGKTYSTCTYSLPYVGQNESIVVSETDTAPTTDSKGIGTGFPTGTNILGVGSTTATITLGTTSNPTVNVGEVVAILGANDEGRSNGAGGNFLESDASASGNPRFVFTNGVPTYGYDEVFAYDASNNDLSSGAAPTTSFVDVDGTPKAVTTASTSQGFRAYAIDNPASSTPAAPIYELTTTAPDSSYFANNGNSIPQEDYLSQCFAFDFKYDGSNVQFASTFTIKNNLTASNPYTGSSYGTSVVFDLSAVSAYPSSVTVAMGNTVTVDSADYDAPGNLTPSSCTDSGGTVHATIAPYENITMPDFTERFTVTPTATGTCTFTLQDPDVDIQSMPVTVTVTAS